MTTIAVFKLAHPGTAGDFPTDGMELTILLVVSDLELSRGWPLLRGAKPRLAYRTS